MLFTRINSIILCFLVLGSLPVLAQGSEKKVLVVESYHKEMYWDAGYREGILQTIGGYASVTFFEMDTKRLPRSSFQARAEAAIATIDQLQPDIVMLGDDNALSLVGKAVLNRKIPLVFLGINGNPRNYFDGGLPAGITGVLERPLLKRALRFIREINPDWTEVLILFDDSNTARIYRDSPFFFAGSNHKRILGLNVEIYLSNSYEDLQAKVKQAQTDKHVLFLGGLHTLTDQHNQHVNGDIATSWIYQHSEIPMFGFWKGTVGIDKTIGGYVIDGHSMGAQAARQVLHVLEGETTKRVKIEWLFEGRLVLSPSALKRWDIVIPKRLSEKAEYMD